VTTAASQVLLQSANTWAPVDALQLHASLWTGQTFPSLDSHMLPLAGTRTMATACMSDTLQAPPLPSPLASTSAALAAAASAVFTRNGALDEHASDLHAHSPWALGGVSRLQSYIHALTCSVVTAQITTQSLVKEIKSHAREASETIARTDEEIIQDHRLETGDAAMVACFSCCFATSHCCFRLQAIHSTDADALRRLRSDNARSILFEKGSEIAGKQRDLQQRKNDILDSCIVAAKRCSQAIGLLLGRCGSALCVLLCRASDVLWHSHHLVSHWASSWVIRCLILAGNVTTAASLMSHKHYHLSPATIAQQRSHQRRSTFTPWRPLNGTAPLLCVFVCTLTGTSRNRRRLAAVVR
jgi:hypothetical protein